MAVNILTTPSVETYIPGTIRLGDQRMEPEIVEKLDIQIPSGNFGKIWLQACAVSYGTGDFSRIWREGVEDVYRRNGYIGNGDSVLASQGDEIIGVFGIERRSDGERPFASLGGVRLLRGEARPGDSSSPFHGSFFVPQLISDWSEFAHDDKPLIETESEGVRYVSGYELISLIMSQPVDCSGAIELVELSKLTTSTRLFRSHILSAAFGLRMNPLRLRHMHETISHVRQEIYGILPGILKASNVIAYVREDRVAKMFADAVRRPVLATKIPLDIISIEARKSMPGYFDKDITLLFSPKEDIEIMPL